VAKKDQVKSSLERLAAGDFSDADLQEIMSLYLKGKLVPGVTAGRDISKAIVIVGNHANVRVELGEEVFERIRERLFPKPRGIAPPFPVSVFIGREDALIQLKRLLGIGQSRSQSNIVIVRGWPGVGKTTLVGVLGRDPEVSAAFPDGVLWASLTLKPNREPPDLLSEMATWGRALDTDELLRTPTLEEACKRLGYLLQDKRMLLILDDVWEAEHALSFLKAAGSQCATLITTRETTEVAIDLAPRQEAIYALQVLTEEDSLHLLRIISPVAVKKHPNECRELVRALEYLPLALHVAGRLINTEVQIGSSAKALRKLLKEIQDGAAIIKAKAPANRTEDGGRPTVQALLKKSTDLLDDYTRECFAFLGPYAPKPATFDLKALKFQWQVDEPMPIVKSLVGHGLMELAGAGRYQMHALLVAHARSLLE
jgi:NB-ARC domain.